MGGSGKSDVIFILKTRAGSRETLLLMGFSIIKEQISWVCPVRFHSGLGLEEEIATWFSKKAT